MSPTVVLVAAAGAAWEPAALGLLEGRRDVAVLKRCVDVEELLAAAAAGQADAALVGVDAPGLDARVVEQLRRHGVRTVAVVPGGPTAEAARLRGTRAGVTRLVAESDLARLPDALTEPDDAVAPERAAPDVPPSSPGVVAGRVIAVWGPGGAPGRSTVAGAVAAELARRREQVLLIDADPYGGTLAQQLGILDEVSGLLVAARLAVAGELSSRLPTAVRALDHHLGVLTGLPRPERWSELPAGLAEDLLGAAAPLGHVVVDTGSGLDDDADPSGRPGRDALTLAVLGAATDVLVVGTPDPVGLTRLARGLVDLRERGIPAARVVVNRMRPTLGWTERDIAGMLDGIARPVGLHFLPDDRATVDRALVAGRTLTETAPDAALPRAVATLVDALMPARQAANSR